jgi:hypothetical protein
MYSGMPKLKAHIVWRDGKNPREVKAYRNPFVRLISPNLMTYGLIFINSMINTVSVSPQKDKNINQISAYSLKIIVLTIFFPL